MPGCRSWCLRTKVRVRNMSWLRNLVGNIESVPKTRKKNAVGKVCSRLAWLFYWLLDLPQFEYLRNHLDKMITFFQECQMLRYRCSLAIISCFSDFRFAAIRVCRFFCHALWASGLFCTSHSFLDMRGATSCLSNDGLQRSCSLLFGPLISIGKLLSCCP